MSLPVIARVLVGCGLACGLLAAGRLPAEQAYQVVENFFRLPDGPVLGPTSGVAVDSQGRLIVTHRGPRPVLIFDRTGRLQSAFGDDHLAAVHATRMDRDSHLWVTDIQKHTVIKFSLTGEALLVLGIPGEAGEDDRHFNRPTDVAFAPNGDFFVSDGYGNSRVVKFSRDGKFLKSWGRKGTGPGEFNLPHCAFVDAQGLLHVSDRENDRIQVFDLEGNYVRHYGGFAPFGMFIAKDQTLYVADGRAHQVFHMTLDGKIMSRWGSQGSGPGQLDLPHGIAVDGEGAVYVTEITGKRAQKFVRRP